MIMEKENIYNVFVHKASAIDISKMDSAIQLLDQMGPRDFYEQFSTVAETTVDNNYGLKVE